MRLLLTAALLASSLAVSAIAETELVGFMSECHFLVPSEENGGAALATESWTAAVPPVDLSSWEYGQVGIGYGSTNEIWYPYLYWDVGWQMRYINPSIFIRVPFELDEGDVAAIRQLVLEVRFDDGFVIHLNSTEVVRFNAPETVSWDSRSAASYPDSSGAIPHPFDLSEYIEFLRPGENVLAIQLLNNSVGSQDAFILPELWASEVAAGSVAHAERLSILSIEPREDGLPGSITIGAAVGKIYVLQQSRDLERWTDHSLPTLARTMELTFPVGSSRTGPQYFRVVER